MGQRLEIPNPVIGHLSELIASTTGSLMDKIFLCAGVDPQHGSSKRDRATQTLRRINIEVNKHPNPIETLEELLSETLEVIPRQRFGESEQWTAVIRALERTGLQACDPGYSDAFIAKIIDSDTVSMTTKRPTSNATNSSISHENGESMKIFISHSSQDQHLAAGLIRMLLDCTDLSKNDIRCTSVPGYEYEGGKNWSEAIRQEVEQCEVFIGLVTENALKSSMTMFELGARWMIGKSLIPCVLHQQDIPNAPKVLKDLHTIVMSIEHNVMNFIDTICQTTGCNQSKMPLVQGGISEFTKVVSASMQDSPDRAGSGFTDNEDRMRLY